MPEIDLSIFDKAATRSPGRPRGSTRATQLSPRAKIALRAVALGMKHKRAAAMADLEPSGAYVSMLKNSPEGAAFLDTMSGKIDEKVLSTAEWIEQLGREAIGRLATMMRFSPNEQIQFKAAQDLADRAPATAKTQRHQVEAFTISGKDARELAQAMAEAARLRTDFAEAMTGDYVRVPLDQSAVPAAALPAGPSNIADPGGAVPSSEPDPALGGVPGDEPPTRPSTVPT